MKKLLIIFLLMYSGILIADDKCEKKETIILSVFKKNDYKFYNYTCESGNGKYLKSYIENSKKIKFLSEYSDFAAKEEPQLLAVSVYKSKKNRHPLLITLNSVYYCCSPQMEGAIYKINFYQINSKNQVSLKNITNIFGENSEGFEGMAEGKFYYNYKNIASIKKWLDKNY
ncbi:MULTISPECIES: hypothetical protein [unclassified Acinetobacter]|uniref:hypothetical protein n=1 Tax=unclassified Acinetobacter TaxID=196816 RepID=UPI00190E0E6B|nr:MULTISPECIES: hypothetical protein [unclassified Acinetobacter]MBK0064229.1 hypothetical protein [Acinetobacter sp. S55]MBK0067579.1 hypothetical protein [Acinetobacter sp. S54]